VTEQPQSGVHVVRPCIVTTVVVVTACVGAAAQSSPRPVVVKEAPPSTKSPVEERIDAQLKATRTPRSPTDIENKRRQDVKARYAPLVTAAKRNGPIPCEALQRILDAEGTSSEKLDWMAQLKRDSLVELFLDEKAHHHHNFDPKPAAKADVAASFLGETISRAQLLEAIPRRAAGSAARVEGRTLRKMVDEKLVEKAAEREGIRVTEADIHKLVDAQMMGITGPMRDMMLSRLRPKLKRQAMAAKLADRWFGPIIVTDDDVTAFIATIPQGALEGGEGPPPGVEVPSMESMVRQGLVRDRMQQRELAVKVRSRVGVEVKVDPALDYTPHFESVCGDWTVAFMTPETQNSKANPTSPRRR